MDWFRAEKVGRIALFQQKGFWQARLSSTLRFATGKQGAHRLVSLSGRIVRRLRVSAAVSGRLTATTIAPLGSGLAQPDLAEPLAGGKRLGRGELLFA